MSDSFVKERVHDKKDKQFEILKWCVFAFCFVLLPIIIDTSAEHFYGWMLLMQISAAALFLFGMFMEYRSGRIIWLIGAGVLAFLLIIFSWKQPARFPITKTGTIQVAE